MALPAATLAGDRFELLERLGEGGFGVVYRARDTRRGALVAVKTLRWTDPERIYRFKREFRSLADLVHPNLVRFHELFTEGGRWYFSMELVEGGRDLVTWIRPDGELDEVRLRHALRQLAAGLAALHRAGKLHRDVKPSNVLVTPEGRVVLLDFGLVAEIDDGAASRGADLGLAGTPAYLAPEQLEGAPATQASDWYAVGVTLHQSLTGKLFYAGNVLEVLAAKATNPPAASSVAPAVPHDLDALCTALLDRDPSARADARSIMRVVEAPLADAEEVAVGNEPIFVGRSSELVALRAAYGASRRGPVMLRVSGPSGIGKTTLVQRFLKETQRDRSVVLAGRCYERESVPYKTLDGVVDALSRHLVRLGAGAEALLPRGVRALERLFPVLGRCDAVRRAPSATAGMDVHEIRHRGIAALKELLARIADRGPLVLWIDDAQWSDADGHALLSEILRPPDPPALLLIASHRDVLPPFFAAADGVDLAPLSPRDTETLARALVDDPDRAERVARESDGNPFFIGELARWASRSDSGRISLADAVTARVAALPVRSRALLEVIAIAGGPVESLVALRAAACGPDEMEALRSGRLARSSGSLESGLLETFHDRIRTAVFASISGDRLRECHAALARELGSSGAAYPERLAHHFFGAGDASAAARWSRVAADRATEAFAFERATMLYRQSVDLDPATADWKLHALLALALSNAGRNVEAAERFLHAATLAPVAEREELRLRAGERFLMNADVLRGLETAREAHRALGLSIPRTQLGALASLVTNRALLQMRGLRYRRRAPEEVPDVVRRRIDAFHALSVGLSQFDIVRGADFQTRGTRMALAAGEEFRVGRALALEAGYAAVDGRRGKWARRLMEAASAHAKRLDDPYLRGVALYSDGMSDWFSARFRSAGEKLDAASDLLDAERTSSAIDARYERTMAQVYAACAHYYMGDWAELRRRVLPLREDAIARGDLHARLRLTVVSFGQWLADDRPDEARREHEEVFSQVRVPLRPLQVARLQELHANVRADIYEGHGARAWARFEPWPRLERELALRPPVVFAWALFFRGSAALAAAREAAGSHRLSVAAELRAHAERDARRMLRTKFPLCVALAHALLAQVLHQRGESEPCIATLRLALAELEALEVRLISEGFRRRLGELVGGDEGRALVSEANRWMISHGVRNPERMAFTPGF